MTKVRDIDPDAKGNVKCNNCKTIHSVGELLICGDSTICPNCGEWEDFTEVKE